MEGQRSVAVFVVKRKMRKWGMGWHLQHRIEASPVYLEQNGAGSWWHSDVLMPGGWHWGRYHNQRDAGGRERHRNEEKEIIQKRFSPAYFFL